MKYYIYNNEAVAWVVKCDVLMSYPKGTIIGHDDINPPDCEEYYLVRHTMSHLNAKEFETKQEAIDYIKYLNAHGQTHDYQIISEDEAKDME